MATVFRPPILTRFEPPSVTAAIAAEAGVWSNRLLDLYGGVAPRPFAQLDWPNPQQFAAVLLGTTPLNRLLDLFAPADAITIFRLPLLVQRSILSDLVARHAQDWVVGNGLPTLFALGASPFALYDWPLPSGTRFPVELRTFVTNLLESTLISPPGGLVRRQGGRKSPRRGPHTVTS